MKDLLVIASVDSSHHLSSVRCTSLSNGPTRVLHPLVQTICALVGPCGSSNVLLRLHSERLDAPHIDFILYAARGQGLGRSEAARPKLCSQRSFAVVLTHHWSCHTVTVAHPSCLGPMASPNTVCSIRAPSNQLDDPTACAEEVWPEGVPPCLDLESYLNVCPHASVFVRAQCAAHWYLLALSVQVRLFACMHCVCTVAHMLKHWCTHVLLSHRVFLRSRVSPYRGLFEPAKMYPTLPHEILACLQAYHKFSALLEVSCTAPKFTYVRRPDGSLTPHATPTQTPPPAAYHWPAAPSALSCGKPKAALAAPTHAQSGNCVSQHRPGILPASNFAIWSCAWPSWSLCGLGLF